MRMLGEESLIGSVLLIYYQELPALYARIEAIEPDVKKDWFQLTLLLLTIPASQVTWILREEYIRGTPFTMGGRSVKLEPVSPYKPPEKKEQEGPTTDEKGRGKERPGKIVPFKKGRP